jgi:uncharacterized protein (TIGR03086 family)
MGMDIVMTLEKSAKATAAVARGVRPEQFGSPTPCAEWNVEQLMNHLIGSLEYFKARGEGNQAGPPQSAPPTSYVQTVQALQSAAMATAAAWRRPGALEQTIDTGAGQMPGSALATMALSEMLTHSWDLAKATGQRMPADDVEVEGVLAGMKQTLKPEARQPNFGPESKAPNGAPPIDRLAAFLGRQP